MAKRLKLSCNFNAQGHGQASGGHRLLLTASDLVLAMGKKHFSWTDFVERGVRVLKARLKRLHGVKRSA